MATTKISCMMALMSSSLVLFLTCSLRCAVAVQTDAQAMMYLSQFGYLSPSMKNPNSGHIMSEETMSRALMEFQSFVGLNLTGHLDDDTLHYMSMPRCGVRDKVGFATDSRSRRYALQGSRWRVKDLTYKISKYPKLLDKSETDSEIRKAFDVWSDVTPLTFTHKKSGQVHIEIRFEKGEHGDGDPFDGPGGTLAHAFFPVYGGDAHFDDSEKWSIGSFKGTNLFQVAAHEFGHSLGLSHSDVRSALMAPFYRGYNPSFNLDSDDIEAIQALYGASSSGEGSDNDDDSTSQGSGKKTTTQEPPGTEGSDAELCTDTKVNALFNSAAGETFVFKGDYYWKLTDDGLAQGYPKSIAGTWSGLPGNIDAAFTYKNGKTYFFKGTKYWKYTDTTMDDGYPKDIADGFAGIPDNVDAALVWSGNGKIYFFKGSKFWKFDPMQKPPVKSTYPKPISNWDGIPDNIDAVLHYTNGYTYFFKDENYYRFNDRTFAVDIADPPFPRNAGYWWFGCRAENKGHRQEVTAAPSILRPTWMEVRRDHKGNQNTDVGDLIMDADNSRIFNETQPRFARSSSPKHSVTLLCIILTSLWWCIS